MGIDDDNGAGTPAEPSDCVAKENTDTHLWPIVSAEKFMGDVVTILPLGRLTADGWEISYDDGETWRTPKQGETKIRGQVHNPDCPLVWDADLPKSEPI